jgi:hypothetical protein
MKKFWIALIVVAVAFMLAVPAMATNVTFSGTYLVRGVWASDSDLSDEDSVNDPTFQANRNNDVAFYQMRFRMSTVFEVSERLSIHTRFDALDKRWGQPDQNTTDGNNIDIDRIWMSIKSDWGLWEIGRMNTGVWGTSWVDLGADGDRIKYTLPIGNFALVAIIQKVVEADDTQGYGDGDNDAYQLAGVYNAENWSAGLLYSYGRNRSTTLDGHQGFINRESDTHSFLPYFTGQFGPFGISSELMYTTGSADLSNGWGAWDDNYDIETWAFNLEATYALGPLTFQAGYGFMSGDDDLLDDELSGFRGTSDWEKSLILAAGGEIDINTRNQAGGAGFGSLETGVYNGRLVTSAAAVGVKTAGEIGFQARAASPGAHMFYLGADYAATEALSFSFLYMYAMAAEEFSGWDDDFGHEIDFGLSYDIYENLNYSAAVGYLFTGDFWEGNNNAAKAAADGLSLINGVGNNNTADTWYMQHTLTLSF